MSEWKMVPVRGDVVDFLAGSGPLDGVWFGDEPPEGKPRYWWRSYLLPAAPQPEQKPVAWIEHHKGGDNLRWEQVDHPYAKATPLYAAPQPTEQEGWQPIETAPKDGTVILVYFKRCGWLTVSWEDPYGDNRENGLWCVDDGKHGPYPVRGYTDDQLTVWMPLPPPPTDSGREKG